MKIRDVEIKIVKGYIDKGRGIILVDALCPIKGSDEDRIRIAFVRALKIANSRSNRVVFFGGFDFGIKKFPRLAVAKIMAQEALRFTRDERCNVKEINFVLSSDKDFNLFNKIVNGYLDYVAHKLSQGPYVTVDTIIEIGGKIILIKRSNPPFGWALPGGFVDYGESLEDAAAREAEEETGLIVKNLKQMHTYSKNSRDPRFHTITTVFVCQAKGKPQAASDAADVKMVKLGSWKKMELAFDHKKVLQDYLQWKRCPATS